MFGAGRWEMFWTVMIVVLVPFGWLYPLLAGGWAAIARRGLVPVPVRRR